MYKAGAKAENSHIDVQNLNENCAVTVVQLPKVDLENFTSDKFRGGYNPRNPSPLHTGLIALILSFSPNSLALLANDVTVVEAKPIMSVNIVSQFQSSTFGHN